MSIISKQAAQEVAAKMTEEKSKAIDLIETTLAQTARELYMNTVPQEVKDCFAKHGRYFDKVQQISFLGNGLNHEYVYISEAPGTTWCEKMQLGEGNSKIIVKLLNDRDNAKAALEKLKVEIVNALLQLKSYKKIQAEFPEAIPYLAVKTVTALTININDIRSKLV